MAKRPGEVLKMMTTNGPVALISKSKPAAIMVDPDEWNATAKELEMLRHQALCDWVSREMDRNPSSVQDISSKDEWLALADG